MTRSINYKKYPVPRIRHHAKSTLYFPLTQHQTVNLKYPPLIDKISWKEIFPSGEAPRYLDIGCGIGKFMAEISLQNPAVNTLGVEVRSGAVEWTNNVLSSEKIINAKALWYSAVNGFPFIKRSSIEKIFYFFPDPWIKKRHHKRRAFSVELLSEFHRMLKSAGTLYLMTDVEEVDKFQQEVLTRHKGFSFSHISSENWDLAVKSNHEEFCLKKNIPFIRMACKKI